MEPPEAPGKHALGCDCTLVTADGEQSAPSNCVVTSTMGCTMVAATADLEGVAEAVREADAPTDTVAPTDGAALGDADCDGAAPALHVMIVETGPLPPGAVAHASCVTVDWKGAPTHAVPRNRFVVSAVLDGRGRGTGRGAA